MASVRQIKTPNREGKRPWVVEYTDASGKRRRATPTTGMKKDADKLRQKIEREIEAGQHVVASKTSTVREVCEEFMRHLDRRIKDKTISPSRRFHFSSLIDMHLIPVLGNKKIKDLDIRDAEKAHASMLSRGNNAVTVRNKLGAAVSLERFAAKRKYTKTDVFSAYMHENPRKELPRIRTFTSEEVRHLLHVVGQRSAGYHRRNQAFLACMVNVAAFCGLRRGEILGLKASNVDFVGGFIRVRHNLDRTDTLKAPKTKAGVRDVPMPRHVAEMLRAYISDYAVKDDRDLIFRTPEGYSYFSGNFNNRWQDLLERCGFAKHDTEKRTFHFHALRHFAASWMIECGWSLPTVAGLLGHSTFDMTLQIYAHAVAGGQQQCDRMQSAAERLLAEPAARLVSAQVDATKTRHPELTI